MTKRVPSGLFNELVAVGHDTEESEALNAYFRGKEAVESVDESNDLLFKITSLGVVSAPKRKVGGPG